MAHTLDSELAAAQQRLDDLTREVHRLTQASKAKPGDAGLRQELTTARHALNAADSLLISLRSRSVRDSFNTRIAVLQGEIRALDVDIGDAKLASLDEPESIVLMDRVEDLKSRRDAHEQSIRDLELARDAAERRTRGQTHEARTRQLAGLRAQHVEAHKLAVKQSREFVEWLAEVGVRWAVAHDAVQDVERIAREMIRLAGDDKTAKRWIAGLDSRYVTPFIGATVGVLAGSRLAEGGLAPYVAIQRFEKPAGAKSSDMESAMGLAFRRQLEALAKFDPSVDVDSFFPSDEAPSENFYDIGRQKAVA